MPDALPDHLYEQAMAVADDPEASIEDKISMLVEIAMMLQQRPKHAVQLQEAVALYERALGLCETDSLEAARIRARAATALQAIPGPGEESIERARAEIEAALPVLDRDGLEEERAEARMNLGLILQSLASMNRARITDAIAEYQLALKTFTRERYPAEFAIIHNNLATAFLSMPMNDERARMREALAVQSFEEALSVVTLTDQPGEYAMLQNNLGNALQYAASAHPVENNLRALEAYDEALKVRNPRDTPLAYANTISNKANCLVNLPDDPANPEAGNRGRLRESKALLEEARTLFEKYGENEKVSLVDDALASIRTALGNGSADAPRFGESLA